MSEISTPVAISDGFYNEAGIEMCSITDDKGFHLFDCFMHDSAELRKRINRFEKIQAENDALRAKVAKLEDMRQYVTPTVINGKAEYVHISEVSKYILSVSGNTAGQIKSEIEAAAIEKAAEKCTTIIEDPEHPDWHVCDKAELLEYTKDLRQQGDGK